MPAPPTRDRVNPETTDTRPLRRPEWIKVRAPSGETYEKLHTLMRSGRTQTMVQAIDWSVYERSTDGRSRNTAFLSEVCASQDRQAVYALVGNHLAEHTDQSFTDRPLTERAEILLGLKPYPKT